MNNHTRHPLENSLHWATMCDAFNNANDKIVNIVCNGKAITNDLTGKIVCDVPVNGNIFLGLTVCDIHTNGNIFLGFTMWDVHTNGNDWVWMPRPIAHELIWPQPVSQEGLSSTISGSCGKDPPITVTH